MKGTLYQLIASTVDAMTRCTDEWKQKHNETLTTLEDYLPSGSGIDSGTEIDRERSTGEKIVLYTEYHHMNETGMYDGWTDHTITVRPSLIHRIRLTISGRDRNEIKDYLHDVYYWALCENLEWNPGEPRPRIEKAP